MKRVGCFMIFVILIIALAIWLVVDWACGAEVDAANWARVYIDCPNQVSEGIEFDVRVMVDRVRDLAGFSMEMEFDRDVLKAEQVIEGEFLGSSTYWVNPDISNTQGTITEIISVCTSRQSFDASGLLFTVKFEGRSVGYSDIRLGNVHLSDDQARSIAVSVDSATVYVVEFPDWDVNQDGITDLYDLVIVAQALGRTVTGKPFPNPDVNGDRIVTIEDLVKVARHFGESSAAAPPLVSSPVPARFLPVLANVQKLLLSNPDRDPETYKLISELLERSSKIKPVSWAAVRARRP
jgi:hypothetical protein